MLSVEDLKTMYESNYALIESKIFGLTELEDMIPWERKVYIGLYLMDLQKKRENIEAAKRNKKLKG
jgi:hypothetical protein